MTYNRKRLFVLNLVVFISGISQGMLLPLIAIILEKANYSSSANGLHATAVYIGILVSSPFIEAPLRKFGYKPLIVLGGLLVMLSMLLFPIWNHLLFWFFLRLCVGVGDHILHFSTQTWMTDITTIEKRGEIMAIYGLCFSLGFIFGPALARTVAISESLPFIINTGLCFFAWLTVLMLRNEFPTHFDDSISFLGTLKRFKSVTKLAGIAFLPPLLFGYLESSLHSNFPVFALRNGFPEKVITYVLPAFTIGSIITQIPLGKWSDQYGRKRILQPLFIAGACSFLGAALLQNWATGLFVCLLLAGMLVGSTFSLGISFMADITPKDLLPAGNLICGIAYSLGSISGPFIGGLSIDHISNASFFYVIVALLVGAFLIYFFTNNNNEKVISEQPSP